MLAAKLAADIAPPNSRPDTVLINIQSAHCGQHDQSALYRCSGKFVRAARYLRVYPTMSEFEVIQYVRRVIHTLSNFEALSADHSFPACPRFRLGQSLLHLRDRQHCRHRGCGVIFYQHAAYLFTE